MKKREKCKLDCFSLSTSGVDSVNALNKELKVLGIDVENIVSIQEFNSSLYPYMVIWYKY
jgi:phosphopantetheinyl transferase